MSVYRTPLMESQDIESIDLAKTQTAQNTQSGRRHAVQTAVVYNPVGSDSTPIPHMLELDAPKIDITDMNEHTARLIREGNAVTETTYSHQIRENKAKDIVNQIGYVPAAYSRKWESPAGDKVNLPYYDSEFSPPGEVTRLPQLLHVLGRKQLSNCAGGFMRTRKMTIPGEGDRLILIILNSGYYPRVMAYSDGTILFGPTESHFQFPELLRLWLSEGMVIKYGEVLWQQKNLYREAAYHGFMDESSYEIPPQDASLSIPKDSLHLINQELRRKATFNYRTEEFVITDTSFYGSEVQIKLWVGYNEL